MADQSEPKDETTPSYLDMDVAPDDGGILKEWRSDWYCYWDGSYDMPSDPITNYVFKPPLVMSECGVVRTRDDNWEEGSYDDSIANSVISITRLLKEGKNEGGKYGVIIGHGDESNGRWLPIAIRWTDADGNLTPQSFLKKIGAHPQLIGSVCGWDFSDYEEEDDEEDMSFFEKQKLNPYFSDKDSFIFFCCGDGKLNPVPCFAVAKMCPGLVAGYVGGVIYT